MHRPRPRIGTWLLGPLAALTLGVVNTPVQSERTIPPSPAFDPPSHGVLFADDFSHGLGLWRADRAGTWSVVRGMLRAELPSRPQLRSILSAGDSTWGDHAVDLDFCMVRGVDKGLIVHVRGRRGIGIDVRGGTYQDLVVYSGAVRLGTRTYPNADATWHHLRVEMRAERYRVLVDGLRVLDCSDWQPTTGRIALPAYTGGAGACLVYYDNVIVTTLAPVTVGPADSTVRTRGE